MWLYVTFLFLSLFYFRLFFFLGGGGLLGNGNAMGLGVGGGGVSFFYGDVCCQIELYRAAVALPCYD